MHVGLKLWLPRGLIAALMLGCVATPVPAANVTPTGAATPTRPRADHANVDRALLQRGYHPCTLNGDLKDCRRETVTGTLFSSTVGLPPQDRKARQDVAPRSIGVAHRGDDGCARTHCT